MTFAVSQIRESSAARTPKRTNARASGLIKMTGEAGVLCGPPTLLYTHVLLETRPVCLRPRRGNPDIISFDTEFAAPVRAGCVHPAVNGCAPDIGYLAEISSNRCFAIRIGQIRRHQERRNFRPDRER